MQKMSAGTITMRSAYRDIIQKNIAAKLGRTNPMSVPVLEKIVINMGVKDAVADKKNVERALGAMAQITGQKPKQTRARKSISSFKLREGDVIGVMVTLRGKRMYDFLSKLISIVLPRIRDFRGVPAKSFDGRGNYTLGFAEFTVFPEIDPGKMDKVQGIEVCITTTARDNQEGRALLEALGMPFEKGK